MGTEKLRQHIYDTVKEWQLKIGVQNERLRLYYPASSLKSLLRLGQDVSRRHLDEALLEFFREMEPQLGDAVFSCRGERYCIEIPAEGCAYIAEKIPEPEFLKRFLSVMTAGDSSLEQIRRCFRDFAGSHGLRFWEEDRKTDGMGHVFYFENNDLEPYVYCVEDDDFGLTYHRFTREDYEELSGKNGRYLF